MLYRDCEQQGHRRYDSIYMESFKRDHSDVIMESTDKTAYHNFTTGVSGNTLEETIREGYPFVVLCKSDKYRIGYYTEYNEEHDVVVLRFVQFDVITPPRPREIRRWERHTDRLCFVLNREGDTYFFSTNTKVDLTIFNQAVDVYYTADTSQKYHEASSWRHQKSESIMRNYYGDVFVSKAMLFETVSCCNYAALISKSAIQVLSKQFLVDNLLSIRLQEPSQEFCQKVFDLTLPWINTIINQMKEKYSSYHNYERELHGYLLGRKRLYSNFACIEKVDDKTSCIRQYQILLDTDKKNNFENISISDFYCYFFETLRIYVTENDFYVCKNEFGRWVLCKSGLIAAYFDFILVSADDEVVNNTRLKYYKDSIDSCLKKSSLSNYQHKQLYSDCWMSEARKESIKFFSSISSPLYESLIKSEYECFKNIALDINNSKKSIDSLIGIYFGDYDKTQTSLVKAVGVPAHVLKTVNKYWKNCEIDNFKYVEDAQKERISKSIAFFKEVFKYNPDYFKRIDDKTFDDIMEAFVDFIKLFRDMSSVFSEYYFELIIKIMQKLIDEHGTKNVSNYMREIYRICCFEDLINQSTNYCSYQYNIQYRLRLYQDYLIMAIDLKGTVINTVNYKFIDGTQLKTAHDNVVNLYNLIKEKNRLG